MNELSRSQIDHLPERYQIVAELGRGNQGDTFLATDVSTDEKVVVKELDIDAVSDWKSVELFERQADTLRALHHDRIPSYRDAFRVGKGEASAFYLVQQFVEGQSLETAVEEGFRVDEARATDIARQMLEILDYLHSQDPPVIHRDIKPSNIVRRASDGRLFLVDFGVVGRFQDADAGGETRVGTAGYCPIEQMAGRAVPSSDLYALGATLTFLITRRQPAELPTKHMRLQFRGASNVSEHFARFLDALLDPDVETRVPTARRALEMLQSTDDALLGVPKERALRLRRPTGSKLELTREPGMVRVMMPARNLAMTLLPLSILIAGAIWSGVDPANGSVGLITGLFAWLLAWPFLPHYCPRVECTLAGPKLTVEYRFGKRRWRRYHSPEFAGFAEAYHPANNSRSYYFLTHAQHGIPGTRQLTTAERHWIIDVFDDALEQVEQTNGGAAS